MKLLVILLVAVSITCIQAQRERALPAHIVKIAKEALKRSPPVTTAAKVQYAIDHPFESAADAASYFEPSFSEVFHRYAGFDIPLNRHLFSSLLTTAMNHGRLDKLTIVTIIVASIQIPPAGDLKKIGLYLVKEFLCKLVHSGLLPGLEHNIQFILDTIRQNNRLKNGVSKSVINTAGSLPLIGNFLKHAGKTIAGALPGLAEVVRVYADDPTRALRALTKYVNKRLPITSTCPAPRRRRIAPHPLPIPVHTLPLHTLPSHHVLPAPAPVIDPVGPTPF